MEDQKMKPLRQFIQLCKDDPSVLNDPDISFFRDYLESLGAKLPPSAYGKSRTSGSDGSDLPHVELPDEDEDDDIYESDLELEGEIIEPDRDPPQKMGDRSAEVTDEDREKSQQAKMQAMEAINEGQLDKAIEYLTQAIILNPTSAIMYATRASVYTKMQKPNAAIRDANAALEINPDSAKGYKSRGMAKAVLGHWQEAAKDLHVASRIDYDEEISEVLKKVEPNVQKIEEHRRRYDKLRKDREERRKQCEKEHRRAEAQAAYEKTKKEEQSSSGGGFTGIPGGMPGGFPGGIPRGFPGGMPGGFPGGRPGAYPGGMPGGFPGGMPANFDFGKILNDPELMAAFSDPEVMAALQDMMTNPANLAKHQSNPRVAPLLAKMMGMFTGAM